MDDKLLSGTLGHNHENGERKFPNSHRDVKRKLSFINKKIGDLQRQRKFIYKNSAKVKRVVHNQVNQVVKCLRARERSLWADVDEVYIAQDDNLSGELSRLQSVQARCQVLLDNIDHNRRTADVLDKIYSILSEIKLEEKQDLQGLEFISDFETMKNMAIEFGHLHGDFIKRDEFIFVDQNENSSSQPCCQELCDKDGCSEKVLPLTFRKTENSKSEYSFNCTPSDDSFEIIDLLENMCYEDTVKDSVMIELENSGNCSHQIKYEDYPSRNENKFLKVSNGLKSSEKALKSNDFNPEEEWKQIFEMKNRIANISGITTKLSDESKICEIPNTVSNYLNADECFDKNCRRITNLSFKGAASWLCDRSLRKEKLNDKSCMQNKFSFLKETDGWLLNRSIEIDALKEERNFERNNTGINSDSPADLIRQSLSTYLTKESSQNWLLCN